MSADPSKLTPVAEALFPSATITLLGCGGFACTFRVQGGDFDLALKVIDPEQSSEPIREEREVKALESVDHPNVVRYRDTGTYDLDGQEVRYLTMEYVDGKSLADVFDGGAVFTTEEIATLIEGIAEGANAIWEAGLAHRDLSPGNVMALDDGTPVIVDLGIARHLKLPTITVKLPTPGTPGWMSPEQVKDSPERGDGRSDQYVIGLLLHRAASGVSPFSDESPAKLWMAPLGADLLPMGLLRRELPYSVGRFVERLTQQEPLKRYLADEEFVSDAKRVAADLRSGVGPDAWPDPKFGLIRGNTMNLLDDDFLAAIAPDGFGVEGRNVVLKESAAWIGKGKIAKAKFTFLDPGNYQDQSTLEHRHAEYKRLPFGKGDRRTKAFASDQQRRDYARPIVEYQLNAGVSRVIAPYFHAGAEWAVDESMRMHQIAEEIVAAKVPKKKDRPRVWAGLMVNEQWVRDAKLQELLTTIQHFRPPSIYLVLETKQRPAQPLADPDTLNGLRSMIETLNSLNIRVVLAKRYSSGLLMSALGAVAWITGCDGPQQNGRAPREEKGKRGGKGNDWYYVPALLNSIKIQTRASLYDDHPDLLTPSTPYAKKFFDGNPKRATVNTEGRILLRQHNLYAMRQQAAEIAKLSPAGRVIRMRDRVRQAQEHYAKFNLQLDVVEKGEFLDQWAKIL